jgi:hypothetical protein
MDRFMDQKFDGTGGVKVKMAGWIPGKSQKYSKSAKNT